MKNRLMQFKGGAEGEEPMFVRSYDIEAEGLAMHVAGWSNGGWTIIAEPSGAQLHHPPDGGSRATVYYPDGGSEDIMLPEPKRPVTVQNNPKMRELLRSLALYGRLPETGAS